MITDSIPNYNTASLNTTNVNTKWNTNNHLLHNGIPIPLLITQKIDYQLLNYWFNNWKWTNQITILLWNAYQSINQIVIKELVIN